ncbi:MAG: NAD(P)/FAD-dependent oxidoreductase [Acidimicrobiales bacterium]
MNDAASDAASFAPRVVVVGAGFAGLAAAKELAGAPCTVTLVDQHNFHTFQPLLYQVATAGLEAADVAYPVRTIFRRHHNIVFRHGKVTGVDLDGRRVQLSDRTALAYDHLVVATGAAAAFFGIDGAAQNSKPLYTLADARHLRNHLLATLESADAHPDRFDGGAPTFVVVGGGPTGVETAGALVELLDVSVKRDRLRIDRTRTRVLLLDMAERLLTPFHRAAGEYAAKTLSRRGVEVRLGVTVERITANEVQLRGGERIRAAAVVWAGGVTVQGTLADGLKVAQDRGGRVVVGPDMAIGGHPEVYVVGDAAAVRSDPGHGDEQTLCPQVAQVAMQSGRHAARQIRRAVTGSARGGTSFHYRDKGIMATIGRRSAVAQLGHGPVIRGTLGWLAWLALHLVYLIGFRNRLMVMLNWCWRYFDWPSGPRLIVADANTDP